MTREEIIAKAVAYARNFADPDFKEFSPERLEEIGSKNRLQAATKDIGKIGRLISTKSHTDFLISENGLMHAVKAELAGRIVVGVVVLKLNWHEAANAEHAMAILDKLRDVPTIGGPFGPFWPVDQNFNPVRANVASEDEAF